MALIYVVEDDKNIREIERFALQNSGYRVEEFECARDFYKRIAVKVPQLVLLDIMLPDEDGLAIVKKLRMTAETKKVPVIMVTAKTTEIDKVKGLELGADDYITKPFGVMELISRVKAVLRRTNDSDKGSQISEVRYDKLRINLTNYELEVNGVKIDTPPKELELIYHLASNPNRVYTRDQLLDEVWGFDYYGDSRTVDVHVKRLREKLENVSDEWSLKTVWGVGYKFEVK